jgi:hypothetical protein
LDPFPKDTLPTLCAAGEVPVEDSEPLWSYHTAAIKIKNWKLLKAWEQAAMNLLTANLIARQDSKFGKQAIDFLIEEIIDPSALCQYISNPWDLIIRSRDNRGNV